MSVAFRREGDDEHLEPKFELPIPPGPNLVTARGLALIDDHIAELKTQIANITDEIDLKSAKRRLRYWSTRKSTAEPVSVSDSGTVAFGTVVSFILRGKAQTLTIVGDDEANPADALVSFSAPISRAMMGASPGDYVDFAGKEDAIEILSIEAIPAS